MDIVAATKQFEEWLAGAIPLIAADLRAKHRAMANEADPFPFMRATFYRWAQLWPEVCPDLARAPRVLAVGDLHIENFGTWRDREGRLVWGINDVDEAYPLPYTVDLVRLVASAALAAEVRSLAIRPEQAAAAVLAGYTEALAAGGRPFVLEESHGWLKDAIAGRPAHFWANIDAAPAVAIPPKIRHALAQSLPKGSVNPRVLHRTAGLGSLGRPRYLMVADLRGGRVAREAKALAPSAARWAQRRRLGNRRYCRKILKQAVRCPDPTVAVRPHWLIRRRSPDCLRLELGDLSATRDEMRLLRAMGWETGNLHLGSRDRIAAVRADLAKKDGDWLEHATGKMIAAMREDWQDWQRHIKAQSNQKASGTAT